MMIEINLVPDVKQELIKAQRIRASVISASVLISIVALGIVAVLSLYVFAVQTGRGFLSDQSISSESKKLKDVDDISSVLTLQNQLTKLAAMHDEKHVSSRVFEMLTAITPQDENKVATTNLTLDTTAKTIKIEGQADNAYTALEVFKKTILATKLMYSEDGTQQAVALTDKVIQGDQSYGEDASGKKVLRFTISFVYPDALFSHTVTDARIVTPNRKNATDSFVGVPATLFTVRANDLTEEKN